MRTGPIICVSFLVFVLCASIQAQYSGGHGTDTNPWTISTPDDLSRLAKTPEHWGGSFAQDSNIDMNGWDPIDPIGNFDIAFTGTYDGGKFHILNLAVLGSEQSQPGGDGLFGVVQGTHSNPTIQALILDNPNINGVSPDVGALVGRFESGVMQWCSVKGGFVSGTTNTGGLVGRVLAEATVQECCATAFVLGADNVGGLVGVNRGTVKECCFTENRVAQRGDWPAAPARVNLGGLIGHNIGGSISACYANCLGIFSRKDVPPLSSGVSIGGLVGEWVVVPDSDPATSRDLLPLSYSNADTLGLNDSVANNAVGTSVGEDRINWVDTVAQSVPMNSTDGRLLEERSTFKNWDFVHIWNIEVSNTPSLQEVP